MGRCPVTHRSRSCPGQSFTLHLLTICQDQLRQHQQIKMESFKQVLQISLVSLDQEQVKSREIGPKNAFTTALKVIDILPDPFRGLSSLNTSSMIHSHFHNPSFSCLQRLSHTVMCTIIHGKHILLYHQYNCNLF